MFTSVYVEDPLGDTGRKLSVPNSILDRLKFDAGEEAHILAGGSTKVIPYYANIKYLLDPYRNYSTSYIISIGANYVDGEDMDKILDNLSQRLNYGIGVGIEYNNSEFQLLYGRYNYKMIIISNEDDENLYKSAKLTLTWKYRF